jgi:hypothetical protein
MSTIGIKELLSSSNFEVINYVDSGTSQAVTDIRDVFALMRDRMELLVTHGKFFEVFNFIISFASEYGLEQFLPTDQLEQLDVSTNLPADMTDHGTFSADGDPSRQLYARIARLIPLFMQHSIGISIDSLLYSLRLVTEYNIASPELYKGLMDLAQHLFRTQDREYMDNPTVALVQYYFIELAKRVPTGRVLLRLSHPGIDFLDAERRKEFFDKVDELLGNALPNGNYKFERVVQGSLEQFISTLEYQKIIWFLLIIGIHFRIKYVGGKCEFLFGFDPTRGISSLTKVLSEGKSILKHLGLKESKREDTAAAKDVMEQAKKYTGTEYFQENNVSGGVQRVYHDEYSREDIAGIADLQTENKPLGDDSFPTDDC